MTFGYDLPTIQALWGQIKTLHTTIAGNVATLQTNLHNLFSGMAPQASRLQSSGRAEEVGVHADQAAIVPGDIGDSSTGESAG